MATTFHEAAEAADRVVDLLLEATALNSFGPEDEGTAESRIELLNGLALAAEALRAAGRGEQGLADELGRSASANFDRVDPIELMLLRG
ncbi:hypothetical protein [Kutzneria sp. NPDC052558]|uniref:hypothetical protein n=1 Tax=Kutzneria sp. NPDC052558 TaxID=3364121 RepID=UPI0037C5B7D7